jgi:hypothetical protein
MANDCITFLKDNFKVNSTIGDFINGGNVGSRDDSDDSDKSIGWECILY